MLLWESLEVDLQYKYIYTLVTAYAKNPALLVSCIIFLVHSTELQDRDLKVVLLLVQAISPPLVVDVHLLSVDAADSQ